MMVGAARTFAWYVGWAALGIVLILLGWQGLVGKGLAAFIAPGVLEVVNGDSSTANPQNFSTSQPDNQTAPAGSSKGTAN